MLYWVIKHAAIRERDGRPGFPEGSGVDKHHDQGERTYKFNSKWSPFRQAEWKKVKQTISLRFPAWSGIRWTLEAVQSDLGY